MSSISSHGVLSVEQIEGVFWLEDNYFDNNEALSGANAISLTMGSDTTSDGSSVQCGAIMLYENVFIDNIGCEDTTGAVQIHCVADQEWSLNTIMDLYDYP